MKRFRFGWLIMCSLLVFASVRAEAAEKSSYTFAVVPQTSVSDTYEKWTPFLKKLSSVTGIEFTMMPYNSIGQFRAAVLKGEPDFAYMNPYQEVEAKEAQGYIPLVRDSAQLVGILVVNKDSAIRSVKDLEGKEIIFPAHAFAASVYMRALLAEKEKVHFKPLLVKSHGSVYRAVASNSVSAGGGIVKTLSQESDDIKSQLTTIYETPHTVSHPIAAHPRVPAAVRQKVAAAILNLAMDKANATMFKNIQISEPVAANYQKDYLPLKKLGKMLRKYEEAD